MHAFKPNAIAELTFSSKQESVMTNVQRIALLSPLIIHKESSIVSTIADVIQIRLEQFHQFQ
jgi:hypothetical protein